VLGTPAYMAPEQFNGDPVDSRSDQFAFCVALFEALYGVRPFAGATRMALAHAITTGDMIEAPDRDVPPWLHREIVRGLGVDPAQRHADVAALLVQLASDPQRRRRRRVAAAGLALGVVAVPAWVLSQGASKPEPCATSATALDTTWGAQREQTFTRDLEARGIAPTVVKATTTSLDRYAQTWTTAHREACEATHVHHTQIDEMLDLEMACLAARRTVLAAAVDVLADADADVLANAEAVLADLPAAASCTDADYVAARAPIEDPTLAATVDAIRAEIARTHALLGAGAQQSAMEAATATYERATLAGHPDTIAEALHARGLAERFGGEQRVAAQTFEEAYWIAIAAGNDDIAFLLATALVETVGHQLRDDAAAQPWIREATALSSRATVDPGRRWQLHLDIGTVHWAHARLTDAQREFETALALLGDADYLDPRKSKIVNNLGAVALERGDLGDAQYLFMRALTSDMTRLGPDHLLVGDSFGNLGVVAFRGEDFAMARAWFERALAVRRAQFGEDHPQVLSMTSNLAAAYSMSGEPEAGIAMLRREIAGWDAHGGDNANAHRARYNLALALAQVGRFAEAVEPGTAAATALGRQLGPDHPQTVDAYELIDEILPGLVADAPTIATVRAVRDRVTEDVAVLRRLDAWLAAHAS